MTPEAAHAATVARWQLRVGYGILAAAWLVWLAAAIYGHVLAARFTGPTDDVVDSLNRAAFIAERTYGLGYVVLGLDALAAFALYDAWTANRRQAGRTLGLGLAVGSLVVHGLEACLTSFFAG